MKPGDRLTLLFDDHDFLVRTSHPYVLQTALEHIEGVGEVARNVQVVVVEVVSAEAALERSSRDTLPCPASLEESLAGGTVSAPQHDDPDSFCPEIERLEP